MDTDETGSRTSGWGSEATGQAMELLSQLIRDCMPSQPTMSQLGTQTLFADGHVAMVLQSSYEALELCQESGASDWGCTLLPYCDLDGDGSCGEGERVSIVTGTAWAISAKSDDKAAAYDLLTALCGAEGQQAQVTAQLAQAAMPDMEEDWSAGLSVDLSAYQTTLAEGTLIAAPVQLATENWADYACSDTMYTAWNNPDQMTAMVQKQQQYTATDLAESNASQTTEETEGDSQENAEG